MTPADHPRSRGVYDAGGADNDPLDGSSPLARGLHAAHSVGGGRRGIIPARAGFTPPPMATAAARVDHPRSRGVYPRRSRSRVRSGGSSPLARGLRGDALPPGHGARIIPARAGFTRRCSAWDATPPDHPRSRGVYTGPVASAAGASGSSPLARGLHDQGPAEQRGQGIIPARAGFTPSGGAALGPARDHPRSRGVYCRPGWAVLCSSGSSPLARGLRGAPTDEARQAGIIPARAGFTR